MEGGSSSHLTRSNSESSDITVESSFQYHAIPDQSAEWTNEKHNAYLSFLEASFVRQLHELHYSAGSQGTRSQGKKEGPHSSQPISGNTHYSSHQLMVLQDGCWQNIKPAEKESLFDSTADSHGILENPWIHRFTSIGELQTATSFDLHEHSMLCDEGFYLREGMNFSAEPAGRSEQDHNYHLCHQNSVGSTMEVSDQNFVHVDQAHESSCGPPKAKRLKTAAVDYPKEDQFVPVENLPTPHVSAICHASTEREEQEHHELLSEHPESFACPRSEVHYFIR